MAAMDEDFDFDDADNKLDDDFVIQANDCEAVAEDEEEVEGNDDEEQGFASDEADFSEDDGDDVASLGEQSFMSDGNKTRFTNYSMTSSVMRRNDGLTLLDDRFEQVNDAMKLKRVRGVLKVEICLVV